MVDVVFALPESRPEDDEDVVWGLSTASALWARGERGDAIVWLRRAADAAAAAGQEGRAAELGMIALRAEQALQQGTPRTTPPPPDRPSLGIEVEIEPVSPTPTPPDPAPPAQPPIRRCATARRPSHHGGGRRGLTGKRRSQAPGRPASRHAPSTPRAGGATLSFGDAARRPGSSADRSTSVCPRRGFTRSRPSPCSFRAAARPGARSARAGHARRGEPCNPPGSSVLLPRHTKDIRSTRPDPGPVG